MMVVPPAVVSMLAILAAVCLLAVRKRAVSNERRYSHLLSLINLQREEMTQQIEQLTRAVEAQEQNRRDIGEMCSAPLTRSHRAQAMHLLRSGMSPETAASSLELPAREIRLLARVSRILTFQ